MYIFLYVSVYVIWTVYAQYVPGSFISKIVCLWLNSFFLISRFSRSFSLSICHASFFIKLPYSFRSPLFFQFALPLDSSDFCSGCSFRWNYFRWSSSGIRTFGPASLSRTSVTTSLPLFLFLSRRLFNHFDRPPPLSLTSQESEPLPIPRLL